MGVLATAFAVLLAVVPRATAQVRPGGPVTTVLVRFDGRVGPPSEGRAAAADVVLRVGQRDVRLQVEEARVLRGGRSGPDVLSELAGRWPSLYVRGPAALLAPLVKAGSGDRVVLTGNHRAGSREFFVAEVRVGGGAAATR